ncbi:hypothetical protein CF326_g8768, partial [Tilletia indica]
MTMSTELVDRLDCLYGRSTECKEGGRECVRGRASASGERSSTSPQDPDSSDSEEYQEINEYGDDDMENAEDVDQLCVAPSAQQDQSASSLMSSAAAAPTETGPVAGPSQSHAQPEPLPAATSSFHPVAAAGTRARSTQQAAFTAVADGTPGPSSSKSTSNKITYPAQVELQSTTAHAYRGPLPAQTVLDFLSQPDLSPQARQSLTGETKGGDLEYFHYLGLYSIPTASRRGRKPTSTSSKKRRTSPPDDEAQERWQCRCCSAHLHINPRKPSNLYAHLFGHARQMGCLAKRFEDAVEDIPEPPGDVMERLKTAGGLRKKRKSGNSVGDVSGSGMGPLEDSSASTSASTSASASASISPINGVKRKDPPLGSGPEGAIDVKRTALYAPGPPTGSSLVSPGSSALVGHQQGLDNREVVVPFGAPPNLLNQQGSSSLLPPNSNHVPVHPSTPLKTLPPPMFPPIALNPIFSLASTPTPALRVLSSNPTLGILAGYNPREVVVGVPLGDLIAPEDVIFVKKMARDALSLALVRVELEDGTAPSSS